jgi:hypothetical protein
MKPWTPRFWIAKSWIAKSWIAKSWIIQPRGRRWTRWVGAIALPLLLLLLLLGLGWPAQADFGTDSRIAQLESRVRSLEAQLNRLESAIARPGAPRSTPNPTAPNPTAAPDPMFDRLATLVIEIKDDLHDIERRVAQLEGDRR